MGFCGMGFLWDVHDISFGFLRHFCGTVGLKKWYSYDISRGFLWEFYGVSMQFLSNFYGGSMVFIWDFYWIPVGFTYGITMGFLWGADGISMGFLWSFKRVPVGFPLDSCGISLGFL